MEYFSAPPNLKFTGGARVAVLAPHPDDESLGAGGLIQQAIAAGAQVRVIFATDGDNNPWPQRWIEKRWRIDADCRRRWGERRRAEALRALDILGVTPDCAEFLGLPDAGLMPLWTRRDTVTLEKFSRAWEAHPPDLVILPSARDGHPDHLGTYLFAQWTLARSGARPALFSYLIHPGWFAPPDSGVILPLTPTQRATKLQAILCHETQTALSRGRFSSYATAQEIFTPEPSSPAALPGSVAVS